jgi:hypothetical protein
MYWADLRLLKETFENTRKLEDEKLQVMPRRFLFPDEPSDSFLPERMLF